MIKEFFLALKKRIWNSLKKSTQDQYIGFSKEMHEDYDPDPNPYRPYNPPYDPNYGRKNPDTEKKPTGGASMPSRSSLRF